MVIRNPNGFKEYEPSDIIEFPSTILTDSSDVLIIIRFADNTRCILRLPIGSLRAVSVYADTNIGQTGRIDTKNLFIRVDKVVQPILDFYRSLGLQIISYTCRIVERADPYDI